jgi:mono/diheme cytochrome c family protein
MRYLEPIINMGIDRWRMPMRLSQVLLLGSVVLVLGAAPACSQSGVEPKAAGAVSGVPVEFAEGAQKFTAHCSRCHGVGGVGTNQGPSFLHKVYEPNHHGDVAFQRAAANGVKAHHWQFGDMPKIDAVTSGDVDDIVKYVRWLQKQAGIF